MQFQVQTLISQNKSIQKEEDELDLFVGLYSPLNSPYNIFLRLKDIENNNDIIYFYAYSMGKEKAIIWGLYDKNNNEFLIDNSCQYHPNQLKEIIDTWKLNKYDYFFTAMRNRMTSRIDQYKIYGDDRDKNLKLADTFKQYYLTKLAEEGLISRSRIYPVSNTNNTKNKNNTNNTEELYSSDLLFNNVYNAGLEGVKLKKYENTLNIIYNELDTKEDETKINNMLKNNRWDGNEYQINVAKHILVHIFLMIFLTIDDYRSAKYINYIHTNNTNNNNNKKLMKKLIGSFLYEWLLEFGKVLRVYDLENFVFNISNDILRLIEPEINMNNVRTSLPEDLTNKLSTISELFEKFIAQSIYSKITYVNNLALCPSIKSCDNNANSSNNDKGCDLYSHGYSTFSKYDQT